MEEIRRIPELRFPGFEGEWEEMRLGEVANVVMGQSPPSESYNTSELGRPLIQGNADISNRKTAPRTFTSKPTKLCNIGDIIMSVRAPVGAISRSFHNACIGRGVCSIQIHIEKYINDFFYQYLLNFEPKWVILEQGSTFSAVSGKDINGLLIPVPGKTEQTKIANFLNDVDTKIEKLTKKKELMSLYKKGMMQKLFSQEIRFKDENGNDYPDWEEKRLGEFLKYKPRKVPKPSDGYWRLGLRSHAKGTFHVFVEDPSKIGMDELFLVKDNDLIVNITFAWEHAIAIACKEDDGKLVSHRFPTYTISDEMFVKFVYYLVIQKRFKNDLENISPGGAGRNRVMSKKDFPEIEVKIPFLLEQEKIANFLTNLDIKIEQIDKEMCAVKEFKKGCLQKMFV